MFEILAANIGRSFAVEKAVKEVAVLGYGSLMHIGSLQRTLPRVERAELRPVRIVGYRRLFNLVMRSLIDKNRKIEGQELAALNVVAGVGKEVGGVAFTIRDSDLEALNRREFCYRQIRGVRAFDFFTAKKEIKDVLIYSVYSDQELRLNQPEFYRNEIEPLGLQGVQNEKILPASNYLSLCLQGAYSWGNAFGEHFVDHTFLADNRTRLSEYLSGKEIRRRLALDLSDYIQRR